MATLSSIVEWGFGPLEPHTVLVASNSLQSTLESLQQSSYASLAITTIVAYDYALTFASEVEYIWLQPWSLVSFLFVLVRYLGCHCVITMLFYIGYFTTLGKAYMLYLYTLDNSLTTLTIFGSYRCYAIYVLNPIVILVYLAAADMAMILRVWAMYGRSRSILVILLMIYIPQILLNTAVIVLNTINLSVFALRIAQPSTSTCIEASTFYAWSGYATIVHLIPGAVTCILTIVQFVRQSLQTYRATKQWQLNQYMNLLIREGILYFIVTLDFALVGLPAQRLIYSLPVGWFPAILFVISNVPVFALVPRFILNIRALYTRDLQGRRGKGGGIDTGFGFSSQGNSGASLSAIAFADIGSNEGSEQDDVMSTEEVEILGSARADEDRSNLSDDLH